MADYFELLEDEEQYLDILIEGAIKTGVGGGVGAVVGRVAGYKVASRLLQKGAISPETAEKIKNYSTVGGAGLGAGAANQGKIRRAIAAKKAQDDVDLDEASKTAAVAGGALGYVAGKKLGLGDKGKAALAAGGALGGAKLSQMRQQQKEKDKEVRKAYADRLRAKKAIAKQAQQAMKQKRQQYIESEEHDLSEDTFAKITSTGSKGRGTGKYAGRAKDTADAAKKARERLKDFQKKMAQWKKEGY